MSSLRHNRAAAIPIIIIAVIVLVAVAAVGIYYMTAYVGYGGDDDYIPTMELTLSARTSGEVYDANIVLDAESASFADFFFYSASVDSPDVGFPDGNHKLVIKIYEDDEEARFSEKGDLLVRYTWDVGNMYGVQNENTQESTWYIELPTLKDVALDDAGAFYLWIEVRYDTNLIGFRRVTCNPEVLS